MSSSCNIGYANFGCDIGGVSNADTEVTEPKELFIRWTQLGAFSPLMENGGHRPWMYDDQTTEIYEK